VAPPDQIQPLRRAQLLAARLQICGLWVSRRANDLDPFKSFKPFKTFKPLHGRFKVQRRTAVPDVPIVLIFLSLALYKTR
jgi:hypothetical protein